MFIWTLCVFGIDVYLESMSIWTLCLSELEYPRLGFDLD